MHSAGGLAGRLGALLCCCGLALVAQAVEQQQQPLCAERSCYPATGNLLVGREKKLFASSTCGLRGPQRYCIVSHLQEEKKCFYCDSRRPWSVDPRSHLIGNVVSTFSSDRLNKSWQAENGLERVHIQLDLGAEFHFTHLIITFRTFRPKAMLIERSYDFGATWHVYRYFAHSCRRSFPKVPMGPIRNISDVICEERYSDVTPSSEGEVIFKVLPPSVDIDDPYAQSVQDLLKITNLRVNFTELHTLGDDLLDKYQRSVSSEKYYYSIYDMVVRGSCSCYGHASRCIPLDDDVVHPDMVYGKCECSHNTRGLNCEQCQEFYNDLPWRPALGSQTNACKKCECHGHATRCHFDAAVYEATSRVSGGVCEECEHNTMGRNCEECRHFFYKDPLLDIRDPNVCKPCDCDPSGSENKGQCESHDDPVSGLVAGRCVCKKHVTGKRCDSCTDGYWNMQHDNPAGCQVCQCNTLGTVDNRGCDKATGVCSCKRNVMGRNCDLCVPGYWGLSDSEDGCKPCDCQAGGSLDDMCDQATGQCTCRPNVIGRRCDRAKPGYFVADFGYLIYEAEHARGIGKPVVVYRESLPGQQRTWTGPGFMRVFEDDALEFVVDNVPSSMSYDLTIRFETQMPSSWNDVRVVINHEDLPDPNGPCGNRMPQDDYLAAYLAADSLHHIVQPKICLEQGKKYTIRLELSRYNPQRATPGATVLIDSIVLMPVVSEIAALSSSAMGELIDCRQFELDIRTNELVPEKCKENVFAMGTSVHNQALFCDCDVTGSESTICNPYGGQCACKRNVIGRRCDQCAPGTYGFGPLGCIPCNCNGRGARDNFCDTLSGQCLCAANVDGRACDRCQRGFFGFPQCRPCQCNEHAGECDDATGQCIDCRDLTTGVKCERCLPGYYGDPRVGSLFPCRPCSCPGGAGSGYQHANECVLDLRTQDVRCLCPPGYDGRRCEFCAENFYGEPTTGSGICQRCSCNGNINESVPGSCDRKSGVCLKCLYNTGGDRCQHCVDGYYGDAAVLGGCQECVCNQLGSVRNGGAGGRDVCDKVTGQCVCQPNVTGRSCDRCIADHWKLASGEGCETCDCDPHGSLSTQCNEFDGQCQCVAGRGGRRCDECEPLHWGDPSVECKACDCDPDGSAGLQCDFVTGQCNCLPGVTGTRCDRCDRGASGKLPNCIPCGECFDGWDAIISDLKVTATDLIEQVSQAKNGGGIKAYEREFTLIERHVSDAYDILGTITDTSDDSAVALISLSNLTDTLKEDLAKLKGMENSVFERSSDVAKLSNLLSMLQSIVNDVVLRAETAQSEADTLIQADINGAYSSLMEKANKSEELTELCNANALTVAAAGSTRLQVDAFVSEKAAEFRRDLDENMDALAQLRNDTEAVAGYIASSLNKQVCDRQSVASSDDQCDAACGGGGCGSCGGGQSCSEGAKGKSATASSLADKAADALEAKLRTVADASDDLQMTLENSTVASNEASAARHEAEATKNQSEKARLVVATILDTVTNFLQLNKTNPKEIAAVLSETLSKSIPLSADEIAALAQQINQTVIDLTDIDNILNATASDIMVATALQVRAANASKAAAAIRSVVQQTVQRVAEARSAQARSAETIAKAEVDIGKAKGDLEAVSNVTATTRVVMETALKRSRAAADKATTVLRKTLENDARLSKAERESKAANDNATRVQQKANELRQKYSDVSIAVRSSANATKDALSRATRLSITASELAAAIQRRNWELTQMVIDIETKESKRKELSASFDALLTKMAAYSQRLVEQEQFHKTCLSVTPARL